MHLRTSLFALGLLVTAFACSDKGGGDDDDDTGGSSTKGGTGGHAGTLNVAGTNNTAGTKANGGTDGGGTGNADGGTPAADGGMGPGPGTDVTKEYTFDKTVEGFIVQDSSAAVDVDPVLKADVMISHNADEGEPDAGSVQLDIPYSAASQYVSMGLNLPTAVDLTGKTIHAWVMIESGYGEEEDLMTAPGNAKLYVKSGTDYVYASAAVANLTAVGVWVEITFEAEFPAFVDDAKGEYDVTKINQIGIQLDTSSTSTTAAPAVVLIDSISY